jgi:hypothetical protein
MMVVVVRTLAVLTLIACAFTLALQSEASDFRLLELRETSVNYKRFNKTNFAPLFEGPQKERITLTVNSDFMRYFFFNNRVHGTTTTAQYHLIGWNFQFGLRLSKYLDVLYEHHSQHVLDESPGQHFPVEDSVGFTLYLYRFDAPAPTLLQ